MNKLFAAVALMAALITTPFAIQAGGQPAAVAEAPHACPMHPKIQGQAGDECPKCGMKLAPVAAEGHGHHRHHGHHGDQANCPHQGKHAKHNCDKTNCPKMSQGAHYSHACPMNPKIVGFEGDSCPKCGMDLEPVAKADRQAYTHACPMNSNIRGFQGDSCPKCGMDLEPVAKADRQAYTHACPMNSNIRGFQGDSCPKCGMDLEPIARAGKGHAHH